MWQTDRHAIWFFLLKLKSLGTLDRRAHHLGHQSGPKSPPHNFFVLTNLDCFDLGTSLKKLCLSQGSNVAYIGHWPRAICLLDRQTYRLTDRQVGRQATDWPRGIWFPCKRFCTWSQCCHLDGASVVQILKGIGANTIQ